MRIKRHTDGMDRLDALKSAMWAPSVAMNWQSSISIDIFQCAVEYPE